MGLINSVQGVDKVFVGIDKGLKVIDDVIVSMDAETTRKGAKSKKRKREYNQRNQKGMDSFSNAGQNQLYQSSNVQRDI